MWKDFFSFFLSGHELEGKVGWVYDQTKHLSIYRLLEVSVSVWHEAYTIF